MIWIIATASFNYFLCIVMTTLAIVLMIILLAIVALLFIPIDICIDTDNKQYYAELKGLAKANIEPDAVQILRVSLKVPFKVFYFYPLQTLFAPKKRELKEKTKKEGKGRSRFSPRTMLRLVRSFSIRKWEFDLDTGDCITNAKLYPVFAFMNHRYGGFHINFEGKNHVLLLVRNRPIYMIKSFINL